MEYVLAIKHEVANKEMRKELFVFYGKIGKMKNLYFPLNY